MKGIVLAGGSGTSSQSCSYEGARGMMQNNG